MQIFDGRQITAARALADITTVVLARKSGVASRTVEVGGELQVSEKKTDGDVIGRCGRNLSGAGG
jgi:hypothetical protein